MSVGALRILHVVPYYEDAWAYGGIPRVAAGLARGLSRLGHQVTVCTTDARDDRRRVAGRRPGDDRGAAGNGPDAGGPDVRVFRNVSNRLAYHLQIFTPLGLRAYLRRHAGSFDVAHLHACHNFPAAMAAAACVRAGRPFVLTPNGTARPIERRIFAKRIFAATAGRHLLTRAARVLAVAPAEEPQFEALGVPPERVALVPNPLAEARPGDAERFRRAYGLTGGRLILFLGKLTPRKGVLDLIQACAALDRGSPRLVIAGNDMGIRAKAEALVAQLGLSSRTLFTGLLTGEARDDALAAADVVAYPSRDEIFGLVPLEALLQRTPVVVCGDSGCGGIINRIGGGLVVPPGDVRALAAATGRILDEAPRWREAAAVAAGKALEMFGSGVVCRSLERVYREVCDERRPSIGRPA